MSKIICAHRQVENQRKPLSVCFPKLSLKWTFRNRFDLHEAFPSEMRGTNWMKQIKGILESRKISISGAISSKPGCFLKLEKRGEICQISFCCHRQRLTRLRTPSCSWWRPSWRGGRRGGRRRGRRRRTRSPRWSRWTPTTPSPPSSCTWRRSQSWGCCLGFFSLCERLQISATALKI